MEGEEGDAAADAGDEDAVARFGLGAGDEGAVGGEPGEGEGGRLFVGEVSRFIDQPIWGNRDLLGEGAGAGHAEDEVVGIGKVRVVSPTDVGIDNDGTAVDFADAVRTEDGIGGAVGVEPFGDPDIAMVESGRFEVDDTLVGRGLGGGLILVGDRLVYIGEEECFHGFLSFVLSLIVKSLGGLVWEVF